MYVFRLHGKEILTCNGLPDTDGGSRGKPISLSSDHGTNGCQFWRQAWKKRQKLYGKCGWFCV